MHPFDRRAFLKKTTAAVAAGAIASRKAAADEPARSILAKDPRLILHVAQPPVLETPPELLAAAQVTPTPLLFVRNCQATPELPAGNPLIGWRIELAGLVEAAQPIDAEMLVRLPQREVEMVVQCSGNGRVMFSQSAKTDGTQWGRGGMGNVKFSGVPLATLLDRLGARPQAKAKFLTAEGRDAAKPGEMDFEHSLPLDEALAKSILAIELNGAPLPAIHGGPVRLVTPGYYGTMHVKWLTRLRFDERESDHTSQMPHYRTPRAPIKPGDKFEATHENSEPNWRMRLKSVVLSPPPGAKLARGEATVVGVAFNDGETRIESVLVSTDRGASWQPAKLDLPESPYAWYRWQAKVALDPGEQQIWARAVDALGRTQPLDGAIDWNPRGYTWNGVEKIAVTVG